jgi:hypothetical protein
MAATVAVLLQAVRPAVVRPATRQAVAHPQAAATRPVAAIHLAAVAIPLVAATRQARPATVHQGLRLPATVRPAPVPTRLLRRQKSPTP